jgi:hypothetical protein
MSDYTRNLRHQGNLPAEAAGAIGALPDATPKVDVDATADVGGGGTTAVTGFQLKDQFGNDVARVVKVGFGVYDDTDGVTPGTNATLDTATAGSILSGAASNELEVLTDATGKFTCTLTNTTDEEVFLMGAQPVVGAPPLECEDRESVTFSA